MNYKYSGGISCRVSLFSELEGETFLESCHDISDRLLAEPRSARTVEIPDFLWRVRADADPGDGPDDAVPRHLLHVGRTASSPS